MLQIVPKWRIQVMFGGRPTVTVWMHDNNIENVLRQVAGMRFTDDALDKPTEITVRLHDDPKPLVTYTVQKDHS